MSWFGKVRNAFAQLGRAVSGGKLAEDPLSTESVVLIMGTDYLPGTYFLGGSLEQAIMAASYSYACITSNAEELAQLPTIVQTAGPAGGDEWVKDRGGSTAARDLNYLCRRPLGDPSPAEPHLPRWSMGQVIETTACQLSICGQAFFLKAYAGGGKRRIHGIRPFSDPNRMSLVTKKSGYVREFRYGYESYSPDDIIHVMNTTPGNPAKGLSPLRAAARPVETDQIASQRQLANLKNRLGLGMIISVEGAFGLGGKPGDDNDQRKATQDYLTSQYQKATADGTPLVMGTGAKVIAPPMNPRALNFFDTRKYSRDEIVAIFGTPPPIVGIYESATLQNFATAQKIWWQATLFPMLRRIMDAFNRQLVAPMYGEGYRLWYDLTGSPIALLLKMDLVAYAQALVNLGYSTNMASAEAGLNMPWVKELEQPNVPWVTAGRTAPADEEGEEGEEEPAPAAQEEGEEAAK